MRTLANHGILSSPTGTPINLDPEARLGQNMNDGSLAGDVMTEVERRGAHGNV